MFTTHFEASLLYILFFSMGCLDYIINKLIYVFKKQNAYMRKMACHFKMTRHFYIIFAFSANATPKSSHNLHALYRWLAILEGDCDFEVHEVTVYVERNDITVLWFVVEFQADVVA